MEFYVEYDCSLSNDLDKKTWIKRIRRLTTKAGELGLRKYLESTDSPFQRYCFDDSFKVLNKWIDSSGCRLYDETDQIASFVEKINNVVSKDDRVVIHIWGHACEDGVGCSSYDTLFAYLRRINCRHLYVNLMNSCRTLGAIRFCDENTTIWYTTDSVDDSSSHGFDPFEDKPEDYILPENWNHDFDIPFMIYDCWDESHSQYDFESFLMKVREKGEVFLYLLNVFKDSDE